MKIITFLFLTLIFMTTSNFAQTPPIEAGVSQTLAKWRAANYSDVRYALRLTLEKGAPVLKGAVKVTVTLREKSDIVLDWRKIKGKEEFYKLENIQANGTLADNSRVMDEHLFIPSEYTKAGVNVVSIHFESPIAASGAAVTRYVDREDGSEYIYSLFVPSDASTSIPLFDQPDLKARFTLLVDKPSGWRVVSNGLPNMLKTGKYDEFFETEPISPYVFAFAAGDFKVFTENFSDKGLGNGSSSSNDARKISEDSRTLTGNYIYVRKSQAEKFKAHEKEIFRLNREAVKYLETYFDFKFPFPKYDLVLIPEFPFNGMEHAGATFLRETSVIFPSEPTKNDLISRANVIFHEAAHQWFGDTVTMKWFDDLWLKEGFAEFMAYKTLEKTMPEVNAWKAFYERNKPLAYLTDSTKGTTPIYQEIPNLSAAKSAYGNIVYRKAPSFLRQAEFYLGEEKFQTAVRAFLKKYQYKNAEWTDLVREFEAASGQDLKDWGENWVKQRGVPIINISRIMDKESDFTLGYRISQKNSLDYKNSWKIKFNLLQVFDTNEKSINPIILNQYKNSGKLRNSIVDKVLLPTENEYSDWTNQEERNTLFFFPNYQDYGYGIFLLDKQSRAYVLANIQNEKDDFLRSMMWGSLWDSVREAELAPKTYVELAIKNISVETDELTIQTILSRVSTAMNYYLSDAQRARIAPPLENLLIDKLRNAPTLGQRITFYRAFLSAASSEKARTVLKDVLSGKLEIKDLKLKTKDKFDIVTRLAILGDAAAPRLLDNLAKTETSDEAKRYAYAARAAFPAKEAKEKYFSDFLNNKEISESWIESAFVPFNSSRHAELTLPYLEKALAELPNLKRSRKIFFINGWLAAFIGGQKDEKALAIVNKFLADNPNLDKDLQRKILENVDTLERAVKIRKVNSEK